MAMEIQTTTSKAIVTRKGKEKEATDDQSTDCNITEETNIKKKPHVPKFGEWNSENISYTACFENARKDSARRNPNDPEENPEAFKGMVDSMSYGTKPQTSLEKPQISQEKARKNERETGHLVHMRDIVGGRKSNISESSSERNNSDHSVLQQQTRNRREASDRRKSLASSGSDHSTSQSQSRQKSSGSSHNSSHLSHDTHTRVASIPKFGDWDEKDPQSGEGFTYIFEQIKEEKKTAPKFPIPPELINYSSRQGKPSSKSKICCCIFPNPKE